MTTTSTAHRNGAPMAGVRDRIFTLLAEAEQDIENATVEAAMAERKPDYYEALRHVMNAISELHGVRVELQNLAGVEETH